MDIVTDVQTLLATLGLVDGPSGWTSSRRVLTDETGPESGARVVAITEDGGPAPEMSADEGLGSAAFSFPAVQIRVRGRPHKGDETRAKVAAIRDALHSTRGAVGDTWYTWIRARSEPVFLGLDDQRRPEFTISFVAAVAAVA